MEEYAKYLEDPVVRWGAVGLVALILLVVVLRVKSAKAKGKRLSDKVGSARARLRGDVKGFKDDLARAISAAGPVFQKVETESGFKDCVGHWRREMKHRIQVRTPDLGALKQVAKSLGYDSMPLSELEKHWAKVERQVQEYNTGKMDASKTPIASVRQLVKDLQSTVVMVNMCLTKYSA
jgi:hypothetical protein